MGGDERSSADGAPPCPCTLQLSAVIYHWCAPNTTFFQVENPKQGLESWGQVRKEERKWEAGAEHEAGLT